MHGLWHFVITACTKATAYCRWCFQLMSISHNISTRLSTPSGQYVFFWLIQPKCNFLCIDTSAVHGSIGNACRCNRAGLINRPYIVRAHIACQHLVLVLLVYASFTWLGELAITHIVSGEVNKLLIQILVGLPVKRQTHDLFSCDSNILLRIRI